MVRRVLIGAVLLVSGSVATAQPVVLAESVKPGSTTKADLKLTVTGKVKPTAADGKAEPMSLTATARQLYLERVEAVDARSHATKALRVYTTCESESVLPGAKTKRALPNDRRTIVLQKSEGSPTVFCPTGVLTRDELDVAAGHLDTTALSSILPGKAVNIGESWSLSNEATQAICLLDGLAKHDLTGKLTGVANGIASFTVEGSVDGFDVGAKVTIKLTAQGQFDTATNLIRDMTWDLTDVREQGPIAPASETSARLTIARSIATDDAPEFKVALPAEGKIPEELLQLKYTDPNNRYSFLHTREWHIVAATDSHLVMRLVDQGSFVAQLTVATWKKAAPGQHMTPEEFKDAISKQPGWVADRTAEDGELVNSGGRWIYRISATGKQDDVAVAQWFHAVAGPGGDQVVVTVIARTERAEALSARDIKLIGAIEFPKK